MDASRERVNVGALERGISLGLGALLARGGLRQRKAPGLMVTALAGYLLYRGATGSCPLYRALGVTGTQVGRTVSACSQITVNRQPAEVYRFWRNPRNIARFSRLVERVEPISDLHWRWYARTGRSAELSWETRLTVDEQDRRLSWHALEGSQLPSAVDVSFSGGASGTEVHVDAWLVPPAPPLVSAVLRHAEGSRPLRRAGLTPSQLLEQDLRRMRQLLEAGETATVSGQSSGRLHASRGISRLRFS